MLGRFPVVLFEVFQRPASPNDTGTVACRVPRPVSPRFFQREFGLKTMDHRHAAGALFHGPAEKTEVARACRGPGKLGEQKILDSVRLCSHPDRIGRVLARRVSKTHRNRMSLTATMNFSTPTFVVPGSSGRFKCENFARFDFDRRYAGVRVTPWGSQNVHLF